MTRTDGGSRAIAVILGSSRPTRICPGIATWIRDELQVANDAALSSEPVRYELVDLAAVDLPFLDEPVIPALGRYEHEHTRAWSRTINGFDGFFLVFPQYNWGYPAILKNALDFLFQEWAGKPVSFASYGRHGGALAAEQIRGVLAGLRMQALDDHLEVVVTFDHLDADGQLTDFETILAPHRDQLTRIEEQLVQALAVPA